MPYSGLSMDKMRHWRMQRDARNNWSGFGFIRVDWEVDWGAMGMILGFDSPRK